MTTVAVLWGPFEREVLEAVGPDLLLDIPADLPDLPQRLRDRIA
jgi:phosphoglycolate phosphatase-like HAD superfamily hydrolase